MAPRKQVRKICNYGGNQMTLRLSRKLVVELVDMNDSSEVLCAISGIKGITYMRVDKERKSLTVRGKMSPSRVICKLKKWRPKLIYFGPRKRRQPQPQPQPQPSTAPPPPSVMQPEPDQLHYPYRYPYPYPGYYPYY